MNRPIRFLAFAMAAIFMAGASLNADAQKKQGKRVEFWGDQDRYFNNQTYAQFEAIDEGMDAYPPVIGETPARKLILLNLDAIVHETKYDGSDALAEFMDARMTKVINSLRQPMKGKGMRVYKVYNDGFIERTKSVKLAFDLVRGQSKDLVMIPDSTMQLIVDECDALFLTHNHGDHVDPVVAEMFLKAGKPVIAAPNILANDNRVLHWRGAEGAAPIKKDLKLKNGQTVDVAIYPGHQDQLLCNVYVVTTPEGRQVLHMGDQYNKEDMAWFTNIKNDYPNIDIFNCICWAHRLNDTINGVAPKLVATAHENEIGHHSIDHREAFWLTFDKMRKVDHKNFVVLGWGEWFDLK